MRTRIKRIGTMLAGTVIAVAVLLSISLAIPIKVWRTGELPASPLPVVEGGPAVVLSKRIWIDTDAACGHSRTTDPDDCFALRLIVVMGRTPGHLFHPSEGAGRGMLFGHGPVFRDFNFDQDPGAAARLLAMNVPMTLVPYVVARQVSLTASDLTLLDAGGGTAAWVAARARDWLAFWDKEVGRNGFYPFDALAAAYTLRQNLFSCAPAKAWVARDLRLWGWLYGPEALLVGADGARGSDVKATGPVLYCPRGDPRLHDWIVARLAGAA